MPDHKPGWEDMAVTRREFLNRSGMGFGSLALFTMLSESGALETAHASDVPSTLEPRMAPLPARAKRVIHLFMSGGPSHVDTFDPKPALARYRGKAVKPGASKMDARTSAMPSPFKFQKHGNSGIEISELFPQIGAHADEMCVIRSMVTDIPAHEQALLMMNTGTVRFVRPSLGSWTTYGLGTENQSLPGFVAMAPGGYPLLGAQNWHAGFLPGIFQGTFIDSNQTNIEKLIEHIHSGYASLDEQRQQLDVLHQLNDAYRERVKQDAQLEARIHSFELAYKMQEAAAEAFDVTREPDNIQRMYGDGPQARQLLIARRLVERGVRFVQCWQDGWDTHSNLEDSMRSLAKQSDQAIGALLTDLKQHGLLKDTLVIWGGEFGRTPTAQAGASAELGKQSGRDHNSAGFSTWMAGGGVKGGYVHGATDELGFAAVKDKVHVHDLHATILRLMGFDHEKFTFRYAGRDFRLTDVYGSIIQDLIA
jgi:hypothetical protein